MIFMTTHRRRKHSRQITIDVPLERATSTKKDHCGSFFRSFQNEPIFPVGTSLDADAAILEEAARASPLILTHERHVLCAVLHTAFKTPSQQCFRWCTLVTTISCLLIVDEMLHHDTQGLKAPQGINAVSLLDRILRRYMGLYIANSRAYSAPFASAVPSSTVTDPTRSEDSGVVTQDADSRTAAIPLPASTEPTQRTEAHNSKVVYGELSSKNVGDARLDGESETTAAVCRGSVRVSIGEVAGVRISNASLGLLLRLDDYDRVGSGHERCINTRTRCCFC